jgi:hypothetical protein
MLFTSGSLKTNAQELTTALSSMAVISRCFLIVDPGEVFVAMLQMRGAPKPLLSRVGPAGLPLAMIFMQGTSVSESPAAFVPAEPVDDAKL